MTQHNDIRLPGFPNLLQKVNNSNQILYFIGLVPPEPALGYTWRLKTKLEKQFPENRRYRSPPHITLIPPFRYQNNREQALAEKLSFFFQAQFQFNIRLEGFGEFRKKVIFVGVKQETALIKLYETLTEYCLNECDLNPAAVSYGFKPHLTISPKDLGHHDFKKAWKTLDNETIDHMVTVKNISLLKHDGSSWQSVKVFPLKTLVDAHESPNSN